MRLECFYCLGFLLSISYSLNDTNTGTSTQPFSFNSGTSGINQNGGGKTATSNMAGCPRLPDDCNFDCLVIGTSGCIECTCMKGQPSASLSGGATLTSSGSGSNPTLGSQSSPFSPGGAGTQTGTGTSGNNTSGSLTSSGSKPGADHAAQVASFIPTGFSSSSASGSTNPGTSAQGSLNINGCPPFPSNCDASCAILDTNGCPICHCTTGGSNNNTSASSASSSSLLSSVDLTSNLNGCPPFSTGCTADCVTLDRNGCPVCKCRHTDSSPSGGATSSVTSHEMSAGASSNANGCPTFFSSCRADCVTLDGKGCPMCMCNNTVGSGSSNGGGSGKSQASNNNGCPAFPQNCRSDCVSLDRMGCPLCSCVHGPNGTTNPGTTLVNGYNNVIPGASLQANGCPNFRSSCPAECTTIDDKGCPVCTCSGTSTYNQGSSGGLPASSSVTTTTAPSGTQINLKECPPLIPHCNTACLWTDDFGCVLCNGDCNDQYTTTTVVPTTTQSAAGNGGVNCPSFDQSCSVSCVGFDRLGCLICTCPDGNAVTTTPPSNMNGCAKFDTSCLSGCAGVDAKGCLTCSCTTNSTNGSGNNSSQTGTGNGGSMTVTCPAFDGAHCNPSCIGINAQGCLTCDCGPEVTTQQPSQRVTQTQFIPGGGNPTTFAPSLGGGNIGGGSSVTQSPGHDGTNTGNGGSGFATSAPNLSGTVNSTGGSGSPLTGNNCAPYDPNCPQSCTTLDALGCFTCTCHVNNTSTGGQSSGSGSSNNGNGCPAFDTSCIADCVHMDSQGCVSCSCPGVKQTTTKPSITLSPLLTGTTFAPIVPTSGTGSGNIGGSSATGSAGNGNGCPAFDANCAVTCVSLDSMGCLKCTCSGLSSGSSGGAKGQVNSGNGSGCPPFNTTCSATCTTLDSMGCPECKCAGSGSSTNTGNGKEQSTGTGNVNSCPPVDILSCPPSCVAVDDKGCVKCSCEGSVVTTSRPVQSVVTSTTAVTTTTTAAASTTTATKGTTRATRTCPKFDESCPRDCISINTDGCLTCTCTATPDTTVTQAPPTTTAVKPTLVPTTQPTTTNVKTTFTPTAQTGTTTTTATTSAPEVHTCAPVRCVYPCDAGVTLGQDNCPLCKCHPSTTTTP